ncbi:MAG: hypothetical protein RR356_03335 [Bacteroidales bacterium]
MKIIKIAGLVFGVIMVILFGLYVYLGGLKKIKFEVKKQGGEILVYQDVRGDYGKTCMMIDSVTNLLRTKWNLTPAQEFGIYYDNPHQVATNQLHSEVGCILTDVDDSTLLEMAHFLKVKKEPKMEYIVTEFPWKHQYSILMGIWKVYPALQYYINERTYNENGPVMEIYDQQNKKIIYRKPLFRH